MIYLDASAILKAVRAEAETPALQEWVGQRPQTPRVTSEIGRVEVLRAARRVGASARARAFVAELDLVPLDRLVQDLAADVGDAHLRTLDALHLASALVLGEALESFVAYDARLLRAAEAAGLPVAAPGFEDRPDPVTRRP